MELKTIGKSLQKVFSDNHLIKHYKTNPALHQFITDNLHLWNNFSVDHVDAAVGKMQRDRVEGDRDVKNKLEFADPVYLFLDYCRWARNVEELNSDERYEVEEPFKLDPEQRKKADKARDNMFKKMGWD